MATTNVEINDSTWTQVLDGAGFVICPARVFYSFNASTPTDAVFTVPGGSQVNGADGEILWAKTMTEGIASVSSSPLV